MSILHGWVVEAYQVAIRCCASRQKTKIQTSPVCTILVYVITRSHDISVQSIWGDLAKFCLAISLLGRGWRYSCHYMLEVRLWKDRPRPLVLHLADSPKRYTPFNCPVFWWIRFANVVLRVKYVVSRLPTQKISIDLWEQIMRLVLLTQFSILVWDTVN